MALLEMIQLLYFVKVEHPCSLNECSETDLTKIAMTSWLENGQVVTTFTRRVIRQRFVWPLAREIIGVGAGLDHASWLFVRSQRSLKCSHLWRPGRSWGGGGGRIWQQMIKSRQAHICMVRSVGTIEIATEGGG